MLNRQCDYVLTGESPVHAHIVVNPTGWLEVEIAERGQCFVAELDKVFFRRGEQSMQLVCECAAAATVRQVSLSLESQDAFELYRMIDDARQELECLMCDL